MDDFDITADKFLIYDSSCNQIFGIRINGLLPSVSCPVIFSKITNLVQACLRGKVYIYRGLGLYLWCRF